MLNSSRSGLPRWRMLHCLRLYTAKQTRLQMAGGSHGTNSSSTSLSGAFAGIGFPDSFLRASAPSPLSAGLLHVCPRPCFSMNTGHLTRITDHKVLNNLFGMTTGLGYLPTTFDWSQIAYNQSPLVVPFWAQANVFAGWFCVYALVVPIIYYTNTWFTSYLPLTGSDAYDNTGNIYNSSRILDASGAIDESKYRAYSPIFLPATFAMSYGVGFAVLSCLITHVLLHHSKDIVMTFKGNKKKDIHARLLSRYPDVPWWWYGIMTVSFV